nr:uncharacterized protein LOC109428424 [Aedes albopictus]
MHHEECVRSLDSLVIRMKSLAVVCLLIGVIPAVFSGTVRPFRPRKGNAISKKGCDLDDAACLFPMRDYGAMVTPLTPTMVPLVRTSIVPPIEDTTRKRSKSRTKYRKQRVQVASAKNQEV